MGVWECGISLLYATLERGGLVGFLTRPNQRAGPIFTANEPTQHNEHYQTVLAGGVGTVF